MPDSESAKNGLLRRIPKQERSRGRIDEILKVSMDLIGRKGIDAVTMKEIATLSGGPIASVYQYFPNKSAIVAMLYERYEEDVFDLVRHYCSNIEDASGAFNVIDVLFDAYYQTVREAPASQDLLNAIQADKELAKLDVAGSRKHSGVFVEATERFVAEERREQYARSVFLMFHLAASAVRLALLVDGQEAACIIDDFKASAQTQLRRFVPAPDIRNA